MKKLLTPKNFLTACGILLAMVVAWFLPLAAPGILYAFTLPAGVTFDQHIKGLKEQRAAKAQEMQKMLDLALKDERDMTEEEQKKYDKLVSERKSMAAQLELAEEAYLEERGKPSYRVGDHGRRDDRETSEDEKIFSFQIKKPVKQDRSRPISDFILRNFDIDPDIQKASVFSVMRSLATGKTYKNRATERALDEMRAFSGTAILNPFLSAQVWEGSLSKSRLAAAGMRTFPLESNQHKFAQVATYPTFEWKAESASTTERTVSLTSRSVDAEFLRGWFNVSAEILNYGANTEQVLRNICTKSASNEIDRAGLIGSGSTPEPEGVLNYTNLNAFSAGANGGKISTNRFAWFNSVIEMIHNDNEDTPTAAIMSPREWKALNDLVDDVENPLQIPPALRDIAWYQTSKVPTNLDAGTATGVASAIIFGGFEQLYLGIGMDIEVKVLQIEKETNEYPFFLGFSGNFIPQREEAFGALTDIIPE